MDKIIIAFIVITFLYKAYKNYKKEMQTAAERAKQALEALKNKPEVANTLSTQSYKTIDERVSPKEYVAETVSDTNKTDYYKGKVKAKEDRDAASNRKKPVFDFYNPEVPAAEVVENRRLHKPHHHGFEVAKKEKHLAADFNFRQALIYDAILRRPQY